MSTPSILVALMALTIGSPLFAGDAPASPVSAVVRPSAIEATTPFASAPVVDDAALDLATAREDLSLVAQSQQVTGVSNSTVTGTSRTGEVTISDNAFQNASGLTVLNANSGNNVAMSGSINVNVMIVGGPQ